MKGELVEVVDTGQRMSDQEIVDELKRALEIHERILGCEEMTLGLAQQAGEILHPLKVAIRGRYNGWCDLVFKKSIGRTTNWLYRTVFKRKADLDAYYAENPSVNISLRTARAYLKKLGEKPEPREGVKVKADTAFTDDLKGQQEAAMASQESLTRVWGPKDLLPWARTTLAHVNNMEVKYGGFDGMFLKEWDDSWNDDAERTMEELKGLAERFLGALDKHQGR